MLYSSKSPPVDDVSKKTFHKLVDGSSILVASLFSEGKLMHTEFDERESDANELLDFVTYRLSRVHPRLNAQAAHILKERAGLSLLQWRTIALLRTFGPAVPSIDIIGPFHIDKGLFSRTLKGLAAENYVAVEQDKNDQRRQLLSLTAKGEETYKRVITTMRKRQKYLLHNVSEAEKSVLYSALDKLEINAQRKDF
ncbi:MAG: MarR family winged helix-turn-helix transcriptional regulator [Rhizobiaceae bacterium]